MLLFVDPPKYGRDDAGHSCAIATHQPAPATTDKPSTTTCHTRRRNRAGPAHRYAIPNAGSTRNACAILVRNPNPSSTPAKTSHRVRSRSIARCMQYAEVVISSTSSASGLLNRNISAAAGVSAGPAPATRPAPGPNHRRTAAYSTATAAMPSSACGTSSVHELNPKIRAAISSTHSDAGVLSTVMKLEESNEPKKKAVHDRVPACTAAA